MIEDGKGEGCMARYISGKKECEENWCEAVWCEFNPDYKGDDAFID